MLSEEVAMVWDTDVYDLDYVRESRRTAWTRRGPIRWDGRVGYSILGPDAPTAGFPRMFHRRVFWLKPHDRGASSDGAYEAGAPVEAVDPRTVAPGMPVGSRNVCLGNRWFTRLDTTFRLAKPTCF